MTPAQRALPGQRRAPFHAAYRRGSQIESNTPAIKLKGTEVPISCLWSHCPRPVEAGHLCGQHLLRLRLLEADWPADLVHAIAPLADAEIRQGVIA